MTVRIGFLGTGNVASLHRGAVLATPGLDLVAIAGGRPGRTRARAADWDVRPFDTAEELVGSDELDAVWIMSPNELHTPQALAAIAAGKHVLVEKPIAGDPREAQRLADAATDGDVVVMPGHNYFHVPELRRMARLVADRALGELRALFITYAIAHPPHIPAQYGGALRDVFAHPVYLALGLLGLPTRVYAGVGPGETLGEEDQGWMVFDHANGATAQLFCSWAVDDHGQDPVTFHVKLLGTEGSATASWRSSTIDRPLPPNLAYSLPVYPESFVHQAAAFRDAVAIGAPLVQTVADGVDAIRVSDAAMASARAGQVVHLAGGPT